METETLNESFIDTIVKRSDMSNATVRIAGWLIGAAKATGGFPLELSFRQIAHGFEKDGVVVPGTGSRLETVRDSLKWLEEHGYLKVEQGRPSRNNHHYYHYTLEF
jgi:hypothetical protein